jgi:hypothetical protein
VQFHLSSSLTMRYWLKVVVLIFAPDSVTERNVGSEHVARPSRANIHNPARVNVHAHTFTFITPAMTEKYKIPNPCTSCHTDKTTP